MPTFFRVFGCKVDIYFNDHMPPHFHVIYAEHEVLIEISTLQVLRGSLPSKKLKKIMTWAEEHQADLQEIWDNTRITDQ